MITSLTYRIDYSSWRELKLRATQAKRAYANTLAGVVFADAEGLLRLRFFECDGESSGFTAVTNRQLRVFASISKRPHETVVGTFQSELTLEPFPGNWATAKHRQWNRKLIFDVIGTSAVLWRLRKQRGVTTLERLPLTIQKSKNGSCRYEVPQLDLLYAKPGVREMVLRGLDQTKLKRGSFVFRGYPLPAQFDDGLGS